MENTKTKAAFSVKDMAMTALLAAVTCVLGPLSIPVGLIPVSLTPFAVFLAVVILGKVRGTISYVIYLLIGLAGVPVFSGGEGGPAKVFGPTGGYLISFILMAFIACIFIEKSEKFWVRFVGCLIALVVSYAFGTVWLMIQAHMGLLAALIAAVFKFIPFDVIKIVLALLLGKAVHTALVKASLID